MTQEEKAKAYDEAIERANELLYVSDKDSLQRKTVEHIFPELKESEDEKTKRILHSISSKISFYLPDVFTEEEFQCFDAWSNAWLEKQDEQKSVDKVKSRQEELTKFEKSVKQVMEEAIECGDTHNLKADANMLLSLVQKPAWSEDDEKMLNNCISLIEDIDCTKEEQNWLKSIKDRYLPQPKQEWSEEDEYKIRSLINVLNDVVTLEVAPYTAVVEPLILWLKSLRLQNTWKPSDEQITWLYRAADDANKDSRMKQILNELLSDLKKLKG